MTAELSIVVPTYRERGNITRLYRALAATLSTVSWELMFVDDDSDDGSLEELAALADADPRVRYLRRVGRRGLSSACIEGMGLTRSPCVCIMDADLQHDEALIPRMLDALRQGKVDIAVGSRYIATGSAAALPPARAFASRAATLLGRTLTGVPLSDPMSGFFIVKRSLLDSVEGRLYGRGFKLLVDILLSSPRAIRYVEFPYAMRPRAHGASKLSATVILELLLTIAHHARRGLARRHTT